METSSELTALQQIDTIYSADSTEWCPIENSDGLQDLLLCGTYQVNKDEAVSEWLNSMTMTLYYKLQGPHATWKPGILLDIYLEFFRTWKTWRNDAFL